jgi:hypothetical protein
LFLFIVPKSVQVLTFQLNAAALKREELHFRKEMEIEAKVSI